MRRLSESELLFLAVFLISVLGLVPSALQIYDKHRAVAMLILGAIGAISLFVVWLLWEGRPRLRGYV